MNLQGASIIFEKILHEDLDFNSNNVTLLQKFTRLCLYFAVKDDEEYCEFLGKWFKEMFAYHKNGRINDTTCIFAVFVLEIGVEKVDTIKNQKLYFLLQEVLIPLNEIIVSRYLNISNNIVMKSEIVVAFYRTHYKISTNSIYSELIKKYNLWKPLLHFYLRCEKFGLLIQNVCSDYISNLMSAGECSNKLGLLVEIITTAASYIKQSVQCENFNDRVLFRSLRLINYILVKHIENLNHDSLNLLCRRCHSLIHHTLEITKNSNDLSIIRCSLNVHLFLKCYASEENKNFDSIFNQFISLIQNLVSADKKFLHLVPEIFNTFDAILADPTYTFGQYLWLIHTRACVIYFRQLTLDVQYNTFAEEIKITDELKMFFHIYDDQLQNYNQLPSIANNILKSISNTNFRLINNNSYLIYWLNSVLMSYVNNKKPLSDELCDMLLNVIRAVSSLLSVPQFSDSEAFLEKLLLTSIDISQLNLQHKTVIRLAIFNLCHTVMNKLKKITNLTEKPLKRMIIVALSDSCWEIRDSVLELLNVVLTHLMTDESISLMTDQTLCDKYIATVGDEESFVRATSYSVLSTLVSKLNRSWNNYLDYEKLLSQTVQNFWKETESIVRKNMVIFISAVWQRHQISNISLLIDIYKIIYHASHNDLHSEVRIEGMTFWLCLVQTLIIYKELEITKNEIIELFHKLSSIGCLQVIEDVIEDEYDFEVSKVAINILECLQSFNLCSEDFSEENNTVYDDKQSNVELIKTESFTESGSVVSLENNLLNKIPLLDNSFSFITAKDFIQNYGHIGPMQILNEKFNQNIDSFRMEDLLDCFQGSILNSEINQKDCY